MYESGAHIDKSGLFALDPTPPYLDQKIYWDDVRVYSHENKNYPHVTNQFHDAKTARIILAEDTTL